jgi:hypothetical protein
MVNRWLLLNFDFLGAATVLVTTLFSISGLVSAGIVRISTRLNSGSRLLNFNQGRIMYHIISVIHGFALLGLPVRSFILL